MTHACPKRRSSDLASRGAAGWRQASSVSTVRKTGVGMEPALAWAREEFANAQGSRRGRLGEGEAKNAIKLVRSGLRGGTRGMWKRCRTIARSAAAGTSRYCQRARSDAHTSELQALKRTSN